MRYTNDTVAQAIAKLEAEGADPFLDNLLGNALASAYELEFIFAIRNTYGETAVAETVIDRHENAINKAMGALDGIANATHLNR